MREFSCPNCSFELNFDADLNKLICKSCSSQFEINNEKFQVNEIPISHLKNYFGDLPKEKILVVHQCTKCGFENVKEQSITTFECEKCKNNISNADGYHTKIVSPSAQIPFSISKDESEAIFKKWIDQGFWNDSDLRKLAIADLLVGHYLPFWTFDTDSYTEWSGESGTHYTDTEYYTDSEGNSQSRTVTKTRWTYRSGSFNLHLDDVVISANSEVDNHVLSNIEPYNLNELITFDERYLLGWEGKAFDLDMRDSYKAFVDHTDNCVREKAISELMDDTYRGLKYDFTMSNETFKHIILPVWICQYQFKNKNYHFYINGQSGTIYGDKPISKTKIAIAVVLFLLVIIIVIFLFAKNT